MQIQSFDQAVRDTNDDAASCKFSSVSKGYYKDEYLQYFVKKETLIFRAPLMNRGYYARVNFFRNKINSFIGDGTQDRQIINIGAGFDTTFFNLINNNPNLKINYVETDFKEVTIKKKSIIEFNQDLKSLIGEEKRQVEGEIHSEKYHLISLDLRDSKNLDNYFLVNCGLKKEIPTLFVSECVLIYVPPENGTDLIKWSTDTFQTSAFITYEQINPDDPFGKTMISNLKKKKISLLSFKKYPSLETQKERYVTCGYNQCNTFTMYHVYNHFIDPQDKQRIERIEWFDELEEWKMILEHYVVVLAFQDKTNSFPNINFVNN